MSGGGSGQYRQLGQRSSAHYLAAYPVPTGVFSVTDTIVQLR